MTGGIRRFVRPANPCTSLPQIAQALTRIRTSLGAHSGGSDVVVEKATVKQLKKIQKTYYVPNNAAVFVGGDVQPDEVYRLVSEIFGSWERGADPFKDAIMRHSKEPFSSLSFKRLEIFSLTKSREKVVPIINGLISGREAV